MYLFFDTETTGLSSLKDHVVQLAWVLTDNAGNIKADECHVIRPDGYSIPTAAAKIHGITTAKACEIGQPLGLVLKRFSDAAARATTVIAHNLSFDLGILKHDYKIADLPFPLHGQTQICTMKLSTVWCRLPKLNGSTGFKWPRLEELHYRLFGEGFDGAHDALADSHACRRCYFELVKRNIISPPKFLEVQNYATQNTESKPLDDCQPFLLEIYSYTDFFLNLLIKKHREHNLKSPGRSSPSPYDAMSRRIHAISDQAKTEICKTDLIERAQVVLRAYLAIKAIADADA